MKQIILFLFTVMGYSAATAQLPFNNDIFKGGAGDGWSQTSNGYTGNNIFKGGIGDGWSMKSNNALPNAIFKGGIGDGWSMQSNNASPNSIFKGGGGDGWASAVLSLGALPVQLTKFEGVQKNNKNLLNWTTAVETNTGHFELQRSSGGNAYSTIATLTASGNSSTKKEYSYTDEAPPAGNNFYRLVIVDNDGSVSYSNIVLLRNSSTGLGLAVFPNPTADLLHIALSSPNMNSKMEISVYNATGNLVVKDESANGGKKDISLGKLPAGTYLVRVQFNGRSETIRVIKTH